MSKENINVSTVFQLIYYICNFIDWKSKKSSMFDMFDQQSELIKSILLSPRIFYSNQSFKLLIYSTFLGITINGTGDFLVQN